MKLASLLSAGAQICSPGSDCFRNATSRFVDGWAAPSFDLVVRVATAEDVQNVVRYANENDQAFLAVSGKHGFTSSLSNVKSGIGIWMRDLSSVSIATDGRSATIEGGVRSRELMNYLWSQGKQTVVGSCECTGAVSPMLGGGHGFLQGQYGLMADNLISANLVLANGSAITVSEAQHSDLFWALRGAGQNFGIVTEYEYKIYDHTPENGFWSYDTMTFPLEKMEAVYEIVEQQRSNAPVELGSWGTILRLPNTTTASPQSP